mmetsp:Transcript_8130/g.20896  ORF Transcript_8130/g.20896 Transcript_8130/m.20896 type:complete len:348 (+) Transcript_8130:634-1677(+)
MLSSGTTRGIVFCGLPRGEVDIVAAILDESGLPPCAIEVATGSNKDAKVGEVASWMVVKQKRQLKGRKEFTSWRTALAKDCNMPHDASGTHPGGGMAAGGSKAQRPWPASPPHRVEKEEDRPSLESPPAPSDTVDGDGEGDGEGKSVEGDEEVVVDGYLVSKPLDLSGMRHDLARSIEDDKAFMDPWYARKIKDKSEAPDVVSQEERQFIEKCKERMARSAEKDTSQQNADASGLDQSRLASNPNSGDKDPPSVASSLQENISLDDVIGSHQLDGLQENGSEKEETGSSPVEGTELDAEAFDSPTCSSVLSEEDIRQIAGKFEDVDTDELLNRFASIKRDAEDSGQF